MPVGSGVQMGVLPGKQAPLVTGGRTECVGPVASMLGGSAWSIIFSLGKMRVLRSLARGIIVGDLRKEQSSCRMGK